MPKATITRLAPLVFALLLAVVAPAVSQPK